MLKNITTSISLFSKKHWPNFLMGLVYALLSQFYWFFSQNMTLDQHKIFLIIAIFICALLCKILNVYTQSQSEKFIYQINFVMFTIVEIILVMNYFFDQYIIFQWI